MLTHVALAAALALGTCTGMPAGDMTTPQYWGQYFLDKYATERQQAMTLEVGPAPIAKQRTVLLITGVTIPAVWFDPIKARLERDGFRTVVYEPPELLSGDLFENSQKLATVIDAIRAQTGEERIDILAECTGGLISRHYIQALGGDKHVSRLVTFISPQHGVPKAAEAALIANWRALRDLTPGSTFLETVNNAPLPTNVPITSIYSCTDEYIQPYATSKIPGAHNIEVCDGGYNGHFRFFYDPKLYLLMYGALTAPSPTDSPDGNPATPPVDDEPPADEVADGGGCSTSGGAGGAMALLALAFVAVRRRR